MALKNKKVAAENDYKVTVKHVKDFSKDGKTSIAVDLEVNGVMIYGCYYREGEDKNGKEYNMLAFPSKKGSDGKYYNHAYFKISDELLENIQQQIDSLL